MGYYKVVRGFVDNPNVYLVCHEDDSKRMKLVHRDVIRVVDVPERNDMSGEKEEKVETINVTNQQSPGIVAGALSKSDSNKLYQDFQQKGITDCQVNAEEKSSKRFRSGKRTNWWRKYLRREEKGSKISVYCCYAVGFTMLIAR